MKFWLISITFLLLFITSNSNLLGQAKVDTSGPKVFLLGEDENLMNALNNKYTTLLMAVCQNDMELAYDNWMIMLSDMEEYADKIGFDIKGIKIWLNAYWNKSGKLEHLGYYLKPNSRNVKIEELNAFFISFMKNYQMKVTAKSRFYHNGSASFPTHYKFLKSQNMKVKPD